jgi:hypothetical protein
VSCRRACALADICPNTWYYRSRARDASALRLRIRELTQARPRFGYTRIWILLRREGWRDNKKRVHRLYRLEDLQVRMRPRRKKRLSLHRGAVPTATRPDQHWSMDFVHDQLASGHTFRVLNGLEFCGRAMLTWAHERRVMLRLIEPGKPTQTPTPSRSTGGSAMSASMSTGSPAWPTRRSSSRPGGGSTTTSARSERLAG